MTTQKGTIIRSLAREVRRRFDREGTGHDWWHIERVWQMARRIGKPERADLFIVELAALLHDIADWKFHGGDDTIGPREARRILKKYHVKHAVIDHVCDIVAGVSYKGAGVPTPMQTMEGKVVQDADRLDALGAIGIARTFAYGGSLGRPLYDPRIKPVLHTSKHAYSKRKGTTINHFYEKLLLLKDRLHTRTAQRIARSRHRFLQQYLKQFFSEWESHS